MDGTLIDSRADLAATVNHTRRDLGLAELPVEDVLVHVGQGAKYLLAHAIPEVAETGGRLKVEGGTKEGSCSVVQPPTANLQPLFDLFMSHYGEHMLDNCVLYPTVRRTLEELHDRGWLMGVNTAKPSFATRAIIEHFGLTRFFGNAIVAGGDCVEMKPSALPLRECASRMRGHRLSSHDWMVGDSWTDMQCAANAGVKGAFCTFGFGRLNDARFTVKINRMEELLRHLKAEE